MSRSTEQTTVNRNRSTRGRSHALVLVAVFVAVLLIPSPAAASGGVFPGLESFLQNIVDGLSGTIAKLVAALAIVAGGFLWMLSDSGSGMRRIAGAVIGAAVIIGAISLADAMGFTAALLP